jgi:SAM-dependent methyltransferase
MDDITAPPSYLSHIDFMHACARRFREAAINITVSPNDTMKNEYYFQVGRSAADCILIGLCAARVTHVNRVLDLPCGHGRVLRHLMALFPNAQIDACDLDEEGVGFCEKTLGATGIISSPDLTKAPLPGGYDLIWVGSLFTHLPRALAQRWLAHLATLLSRTGIVVATTHGRWCEHAYAKAQYIAKDRWDDLMRNYRASGFGYASYSREESHDFIDTDYGVSISRPSITIHDIEAIPSVRIYAYMERAWADHHDVVVFGQPSFDTPWP